MTNGKHEWSFGNGDDGSDHANSGYTLLGRGRILHMGMAAATSSGLAPGQSEVALVINGVEVDRSAYKVTKPDGQYSSTTTFSTPLDVHEGDRINFRSVSTNPSVSTATVSLLIELDM